jgi:TRAP-type mannitol/chloroaromatic compound transport system substrate-binding protein
MKEEVMKRFLVLVAACAAAIAVSGAALAQQKTRLNVQTVFPTTLPLLGEAAPSIAKKVERATGGAVELKIHEPGALVPAGQAIQAASQGSVDAAFSGAGFFASVDTTFNMFSTVPFGPGTGEFLAWMYYGGGLEQAREMFGKHGIYNIPCGFIPPEASGWFRKEIKTVADLKGLKMRFFGLGAKVMEKLGVSTQLLLPGDIFQALQLGTIDATEFSVPTADMKFGFYQVAKFYYFPGWHQQATFLDLYVHKKKWDALSDPHKAIIEQGCGDNIREAIALGEATQFKAMREMQDKHGVQIKRWSPEIMAAMEKAWNEVIAEESAKNPNFKKVYASYAKFRADYAIWREYGYLK